MTIEDLLNEIVAPFEDRSGGWNDVLSRARRARRRYALIAAAVSALVLVPTSVRRRGELSDRSQGPPAPPAVSTWFADQLTQKGFATKFPHADVARAHGVLEVETSDGPEDLWVAPDDQGGQCWFIDFADDPPGPGGQYGFGGCYPVPQGLTLGTTRHGTYVVIDPRLRVPATDVDWGAVWISLHPALQTLWGRVRVPAARVEADLADGSTLRLPVVESFFLASLSKNTRVTQIRAYDASGAQVATALPHPRH